MKEKSGEEPAPQENTENPEVKATLEEEAVSTEKLDSKNEVSDGATAPAEAVEEEQAKDEELEGKLAPTQSALEAKSSEMVNKISELYRVINANIQTCNYV